MKRFLVLGAVMMTLAACGGEGSSSNGSAATSTAQSAGSTQVSPPVSATSASSKATPSTGKSAASSAPSSSASTGTSTSTSTNTSATSTVASVQLSLSGSPAKSATVGNWYAFQPSVPAQGKLSFSVSNAPRWATFNAATGELSGTPEADDVGTYANITVSVSNGTQSVSMPAYAITVTQSDANSVALSWNPPTTNTDGTPITQLAGYRVSYGHDAASMTQTVEIANPKAKSFELANLPAGQWYVSMVAYSSDGTTSTPSAAIQVSI